MKTDAYVETPAPDEAVAGTIPMAPAPPASAPPQPTQKRRAQLIALAAVCIVIASVLVTTRRWSQPVVARASDLQPHVDTQVLDVALAAPIDQKEASAAAPRAAADQATIAKRPIGRAAPAANAVSEQPPTGTSGTEAAAHVDAAESPATTPAVARPTDTHATGSRVETEGEEQAPVTISGCVEADVSERAFRLTDTDGADAPKSRSWKSGFLRKRPAAVALIDANNALRLRSYVGKRIAATGLLMNREMQVRSLLPAGASCGE